MLTNDKKEQEREVRITNIREAVVETIDNLIRSNQTDFSAAFMAMDFETQMVAAQPNLSVILMSLGLSLDILGEIFLVGWFMHQILAERGLLTEGPNPLSDIAEPIGKCSKCGSPVYTVEGFCGICGQK